MYTKLLHSKQMFEMRVRENALFGGRKERSSKLISNNRFNFVVDSCIKWSGLDGCGCE